MKAHLPRVLVDPGDLFEASKGDKFRLGKVPCTGNINKKNK